MLKIYIVILNLLMDFYVSPSLLLNELVLWVFFLIKSHLGSRNKIENIHTPA